VRNFPKSRNVNPDLVQVNPRRGTDAATIAHRPRRKVSVIVRLVCLGLVSLGSVTPTAMAQVVYEPVRIQYGGPQPYYYAGSNPWIHAAAAFPNAPGTTWGRFDGYAFANDRRQVVQRNVRTFTDALGPYDAYPLGLTPDQVQNEAYARLPRYFRKGDSLRPTQAESCEPPRRAGTIVIRPYRRSPSPSPSPTTRPADATTGEPTPAETVPQRHGHIGTAIAQRGD
jgi:hypothetical protein